MAADSSLTRLIQITADLSPSSEAGPEPLERIRSAIAATEKRPGEPASLFGRRDLSVAASVFPGPTETAGRAIAETAGPFLDPIGAPVWIDRFHLVEFVSVIRSGAAQPFLYIPILIGGRVTDHVSLAAGSIWCAARAFDSSAPANGYCGLRIKGGRIRFPGAVTQTGNQITVPAFSTVTVSIETDPPAAPTGSGPGEDARQAHVKLPAHGTLRFAPGAAALESASDAELT